MHQSLQYACILVRPQYGRHCSQAAANKAGFWVLDLGLKVQLVGPTAQPGRVRADVSLPVPARRPQLLLSTA